MFRTRKIRILTLGFGILAFTLSFLIGGQAIAASLHEAAMKGNLVEVERLIERGANINTKGTDEMTPLHFAAQESDWEIAEVLIKRGSDINAIDVNGWTPLHFAALHGYEDMAVGLIYNGANVNAMANDATSPLHYAAYMGHRDVVDLLISKGADVNASKIYGWDLNQDYGLERMFERIDVVELVMFRCSNEVNSSKPPSGLSNNIAEVRMKAPVAAKDEGVTGWTPLHYAGFNGHRDVVELLILNGADVYATDILCKTPSDYAAFWGHAGVVEMLRTHTGS